MPGTRREPENAREIEDLCAALGERLGLEVRRQLPVGRRIWGARRRIDLVLTDRESRRALGIECKFQGSKGTAEEKIPATIQDIAAWPIDGLICFAGPGFTEHIRYYMLSTGKGVDYADLEAWLRLYFLIGE